MEYARLHKLEESAEKLTFWRFILKSFFRVQTSISSRIPFKQFHLKHSATWASLFIGMGNGRMAYSSHPLSPTFVYKMIHFSKFEDLIAEMASPCRRRRRRSSSSSSSPSELWTSRLPNPTHFFELKDRGAKSKTLHSNFFIGPHASSRVYIWVRARKREREREREREGALSQFSLLSFQTRFS